MNTEKIKNFTNGEQNAILIIKDTFPGIFE
jgi:hypothetical protein